MNVGIACYASVGGSGVVAAELARCLAARGHRTHVISTDPPFRLRESDGGVRFHRVETPGYPLFREPQYLLALANRLVQVARAYRLDIIHAHYAIPHAAAAYLARQILAGGSADARTVPRTITTLHGTDVTILGSDPSYRETVAFCIDQSDAVTAVSASLRADTKRAMPVERDITVIPNFVDLDDYRRRTDPSLRARFAPSGERVVIHISNLRPVKQVDAVVRLFARIRERVAARLLIVGEGPELGRAEQLIGELGLHPHVELVGEAQDVVGLLSVSDLFVLPSLQESFGLSALEAAACGVPVVASNVGGLPEVVTDGVTGYLHPPGHTSEMAESAIQILSNPELHARMAADGVRLAAERFSADRVVPQYEELYERTLSAH
ncbi:MAG: N-acetyl-alpha-D-glucosaminyl L-malate synthase BshA [Cyanobacteria bacterium]|nr:N-acetyl-alpha-D-glucosaminyl L-malate synthase BshA [Cyanobacteriota bacterium]